MLLLILSVPSFLVWQIEHSLYPTPSDHLEIMLFLCESFPRVSLYFVSSHCSYARLHEMSLFKHRDKIPQRSINKLKSNDGDMTDRFLIVGAIFGRLQVIHYIPCDDNSADRLETNVHL